MENNYNNDNGALSWLEFMDSSDGAIFRDTLGGAVAKRLTSDKNLNILDAACGSGWLSKRLSDVGHKVQGCDGSKLLVDHAKTNFPGINFSVADLNSVLPFADSKFDAITLSMATIDLPDLSAALKNLHRCLKPGGKLIAIIPNPYYAYPVGVWKRGLLGRLLGQRASLRVRPYNFYERDSNREFSWNKNQLQSYFYTLPEQINAVQSAGFKLSFIEDITLAKDSSQFSLSYRLYRFPIFMLMEFTKP